MTPEEFDDRVLSVPLAEFDRALGKRLRIARFKLGITEVEAAAAFDISLRSYRKWESGQPHSRSSRPLLRFANKYDVALDWLLAGIGDMEGNTLH